MRQFSLGRRKFSPGCRRATARGRYGGPSMPRPNKLKSLFPATAEFLKSLESRPERDGPVESPNRKAEMRRRRSATTRPEPLLLRSSKPPIPPREPLVPRSQARPAPSAVPAVPVETLPPPGPTFETLPPPARKGEALSSALPKTEPVSPRHSDVFIDDDLVESVDRVTPVLESVAPLSQAPTGLLDQAEVERLRREAGASWKFPPPPGSIRQEPTVISRGDEAGVRSVLLSVGFAVAFALFFGVVGALAGRLIW